MELILPFFFPAYNATSFNQAFDEFCSVGALLPFEILFIFFTDQVDQIIFKENSVFVYFILFLFRLFATHKLQ